jgi:hypothetical protein
VEVAHQRWPAIAAAFRAPCQCGKREMAQLANRLHCQRGRRESAWDTGRLTRPSHIARCLPARQIVAPTDGGPTGWHVQSMYRFTFGEPTLRFRHRDASDLGGWRSASEHHVESVLAIGRLSRPLSAMSTPYGS